MSHVLLLKVWRGAEELEQVMSMCKGKLAGPLDDFDPPSNVL